MGEAVFFRNLTTKGLTAVNSGERYFEGYLTVQVKDKQGEVTIVDELMKVLPVWIDRGAPISDTHSNRIIGKGINYSKVEYKDKDGEIYPAIKVTGKIHKNYELDNDIWMKIKSGEYKGLSFGGATKSDREPMRMKDGSIAYSLKDLEHYEVAVCRDPAVPLALITEFNTLAKAAVDGQDLGGGRMLIKCDKFGCYVDKGERSHQAEQVELDQAIGNIRGQTDIQNTTRRFGIGRGGARFKKPTTKDNSEGGLKAPEARNEALVYDDKTHDQPSETPEENQKKIQKGKREHPSKEESEAIIAGKVPGAFGDRNTDMYKKPTDLGKSAEDCFLCNQKHENGTYETEFDSTVCDSCVDHLAAGEGRGHQPTGKMTTDHLGRPTPEHKETGWKKDLKGHGGEDIEADLISDDLKERGHPKFKKTPWRTRNRKKGEDVNKITPISEAGHTAMTNEYYGQTTPNAKPREAKQKPFCPSCGRDHVKEDKKVVQNYRDTHGGSQPTTMVMSTGAPDYKPTCPSGNCPSHSKKKGEDWSNADGDRHGMYNQDTDEGGMGKKHTGPKGCKCGDPKCKDPKCKKHKREVGTGYGAEENDTGEVGWSGSGSPYPKKKGEEEKEERDQQKEQEEFDRINPNWSKKPRKKKAIITNIRTRLKNLDFMLKRKNNSDEQDEVSAEHKTHNTVVPAKPKTTKIVTPDGDIYYVEFPEDDTYPLGGKPGKTGKKKRNRKKTEEATPGHYDSDDKIIPTKRKKKAVITNVHSRLKNIQSRIEISDFLLRKGDDKETDYIAGKGKKSRWHLALPQTSGKKKEKKRKRGAGPGKGPAERERDEYKKNPDPEVQANYDKNIEEMGKKKSYFMRVKDGEFGGMNTGEAEWTEPRDTANSRTKRDKDVA